MFALYFDSLYFLQWILCSLEIIDESNVSLVVGRQRKCSLVFVRKSLEAAPRSGLDTARQGRTKAASMAES